MLAISPSVLAAFERGHGSDEVGRFSAWWRRHSHVLAERDVGALADLLAYARNEALRLGIEDNSENRIFLYAAAFALAGQMNGVQFLLVADTLFLDESDEKRLAAIVEALAANRHK